MAKRDIFTELLEGLHEVQAYEQGKITLRTHNVEPKPLPEITGETIREVRNTLDMSRAVFAHLLRVPTRTLEGWEQGKSNPTASAAALILLVQKHPDTIDRLQTL